MKKHLSKIIFALLVIIFIIICAITAPITESAGTLWSLLPPIVAIGLALITKEVYSSLFIGILTGGILTAANAGTGFEGMQGDSRLSYPTPRHRGAGGLCGEQYSRG